MRLLLVGAFPYPLAQGSQVYFQEQAHALRDAGARVELLTYASGAHTDDLAPRALADFRHHTPTSGTARVPLRSGPSLAKPLADAALALALRRLVSSRKSDDGFDAVLTHNSEAAFAALWGLRGSSIPHVYCVHTLLGQELTAYIRFLKSGPGRRSEGGGRRRFRRVIDRAGHAIDAALARRVDGWIALTHEASRVMRAYSNRPGALIPPPLPDPKIAGEAVAAEAFALTRQFDLESKEYFLYSGNLDGYQELDVLADAAALLARTASAASKPPRIIVASHDSEAPHRIAQLPGLESRRVESAQQMLMLMRHARVCILMRQAEGGYPIKLVNAHAVGTPSIAFLGREWGLVDGQNALLANPDRPGPSLAEAILRLRDDDRLVERLGQGARSLYLAQHRPEQTAAQTLTLVEQAIAGKHGSGGSEKHGTLPRSTPSPGETSR